MFRIASTILMLALLCPVAFSQPNNTSLGTIKLRAEAGDKAAQDKLGESCLSSFYHEEAVKWFRSAAEQGVVNSQWRLGQIYFIGKSAYPQRSVAVPANPAQAVHWFKKAAASGHSGAQRDLGLCYQWGKGVTKDNAEAYKWFSLAAKRDSIMAGQYRDSLALKMKPAEIHEAEQRIASFVPGTLPSVWEEIQLKGISGPPQRRLAIINTKTVEAGEKFVLNVSGETFSVTCEKLTEKSVFLSIGNEVRELTMNGSSPR